MDPAEPPPREHGDVGTRDGLKSDVTGLRQQHGTETDGQIRHPRCAFANVAKFMGESCARMDFEEQFRQIHPWEPVEYVVP